MKLRAALPLAVLAFCLPCPSMDAQRVMERLGRGVVAVNAGPILFAADISNLEELCARLRAPSDPFSVFLKQRLSEYTRQSLTNPAAISSSILPLLVEDLNATIQQGESIYTESRFTNVVISEEAKSLIASPSGPEQVLRLNRLLVSDALPSIVARPHGNAVFISWRLLASDPENVSFNVYRSIGTNLTKLNPQPLTNGTWLFDTDPHLSEFSVYSVRVITGSREETAGGNFQMPPHSGSTGYISIPLQNPPGCTPNDGVVADLDGDGEYEIVLKQEMRPRDNSNRGPTGETRLQAYRLDGTLLWTINLGKNIREGAHYTQFMVYDLDSDGRAEVACKTADGTIDGKGKVIGDPEADHRNASGHVLEGSEYFSIFDGLTGAALVTTNYLPPRVEDNLSPTPGQIAAVWGDGNGNRSDRYLACVAYLDGRHPSVVMCRGYYTRTTLAAWDWRDGKLGLRWFFDSDDGTEKNRRFRGQGNHNLTVADVDGDGRDEIIYGACAIDDDGTGLYSTGIGHGDALHVSDLDPDRAGLEVFSIQERFDDAGSNFRDARTGEILWKIASVRAGEDGEGPGRGCALNIDPRFRGSECWSFGAGITGLYNAKGEKISDRSPSSCNFGIWWDGDLLRELLDRNRITKWNWSDGSETRLLTAAECVQNNGTKATPVLSADILGDWREEVIWRTRDNRELRVYTTTIPTAHRLRTLMQDPQYRLSICWQNTGYNQPPHTSFYMGGDTAPPPK